MAEYSNTGFPGAVGSTDDSPIRDSSQHTQQGRKI
jgi:hypothetical protein